MDNLILAILTAAGFIFLWIKMLGYSRAIRFQVLGDILITGTLMWLGKGTYSGMVLAALTGFFVSSGLWAMKTISKL